MTTYYQNTTGMPSMLQNALGGQQQVAIGNDKSAGQLASDVKDWWNRKNAPQIGQNPYMSQWGQLIAQLQAQGNGTGPSLAGNAYKEAQQTGMQNVLAMSRGGSAGAARAGMQNLGRMNQGLSQGYANARLQEQMAARQQLQMALAGAGNAWFAPQQANLQATMGTQTNGQQLMQFASQLAPALGMIAGGGGGGGAEAAAMQGAYSGAPPGAGAGSSYGYSNVWRG